MSAVVFFLVIIGYCIGFLTGVLACLFLNKKGRKTTEKTLEDIKDRFPGKQVEETKDGYNIVINGMPFSVDKKGNYIWGDK